MSCENPGIVAVVSDLMFSSKITATAASLGKVAKIVRNSQNLQSESASLILIDLNQPGTIDAAVQWKSAHAGRVIGFVSHVDDETIARARAAGIDQIMSRGQFVRELDRILSE